MEYRYSEKHNFDFSGYQYVLHQLPLDWQRKSVTSALRAAAKPMAAAAKRHAVKTSGALAESIKIKANRKGRRGGMVSRVWILPVRTDSKAIAQYMTHYGKGIDSKRIKQGIRHGHLVEFGFRAGNKQVGARPFLQPAFDQTWRKSVSVFKETLAKRTESRLKKLRKEAKARYG